MKNELQNIAVEMRKITGKDCEAKRQKAFEDYCEVNGIPFDFAGDKPGGRACEVREMADRFRVFVRCGYGRNNYAPCYEVRK